MAKKELRPFFAPISIIIIGASRKLLTFNYTLIKNLRELRYRGNLYILHPEAEEILGVKAYSDLDMLPEKPELAIILLKNKIVDSIKQLAEFGIKYFIIQSDISMDPNLNTIKNELNKLATQYDLHIMGPASIGIINTENYFTTSVIPVRRHIIQKHRKMNQYGGLSYLAQSGGLAGALGWWAPTQNIPISKVIHTGSYVNVSDADVVEYLFNDPSTSVIALYLRNITQDLIEVVKKYAGTKPVLFKYVGKSEEHIKNMRIYALEVDNYIELFEFAKIFLWCPPPKGNNLAIIGPSSGAIRLLTAEMRKWGLHLARLNPATKQIILNKVGGSTCLEGNPVDYWPPKKFIGTEICKIYYTSSNILLKDESVDALFLALEFFSEIEFDFDIFYEIKKRFPNKPIITILIQAEKEGQERIVDCATQLRIPVFIDEIERAIRGYKLLLDYYQKKS
ncbi:MAG: CoA-binding protein [Promethearchaeota archaeon]